MKLAAQDDPLGSKPVVLYMLINNCCADGGICIVDYIHATGCKL
jgi:hypothetical protein